MPKYVAIVCRTPGVAVCKRVTGKFSTELAMMESEDYAAVCDHCREYNQRLKRSRRCIRRAYRAINRKQAAPAFNGYLSSLKRKISSDLLKVEAGEIVECP